MGVEEANPAAPAADTAADGVEDLLEAARYDDIDDVKSIASAGVSLDSKDLEGRTALHMAAANGHLEIVKYLISKKVVEVVKALIMAGANLSLLNSHERTPVDESVSRGKLDIVDAINEALAQSELTGVELS